MGQAKEQLRREMEAEAEKYCPECGGSRVSSSNDGDGEEVPCMFCMDGSRESFERMSAETETEHQKECVEERVASFMFDLLRDHVCAGVVEKLVRESRTPPYYAGPGSKEQAALARYYARRLLGKEG